MGATRHSISVQGKGGQKCKGRFASHELTFGARAVQHRMEVALGWQLGLSPLTSADLGFDLPQILAPDLVVGPILFLAGLAAISSRSAALAMLPECAACPHILVASPAGHLVLLLCRGLAASS